QRVDVRLRDRLDPHGLPDDGGRGVPDALWLGVLLADGLIAFGGRIPDVDGDGVELAGEVGGDVESEGVVAAGVLADFLAIDVNRGVPVHRAEIQQDFSAFPAFGEAEVARVADAILCADGFHHAG